MCDTGVPSTCNLDRLWVSAVEFLGPLSIDLKSTTLKTLLPIRSIMCNGVKTRMTKNLSVWDDSQKTQRLGLAALLPSISFLCKRFLFFAFFLPGRPVH